MCQVSWREQGLELALHGFQGGTSRRKLIEHGGIGGAGGRELSTISSNRWLPVVVPIQLYLRQEVRLTRAIGLQGPRICVIDTLGHLIVVIFNRSKSHIRMPGILPSYRGPRHADCSCRETRFRHAKRSAVHLVLILDVREHLLLVGLNIVGRHFCGGADV